MPRFDVSPAAPPELLAACRLLFTAPRSEQARERLLSAGAASGVFVARAAGRLCGAALVQALPGAVGVTCPPRGDSAEAEDAVTAAGCAWLRERGVKVCQAFAVADEVGGMAPLERAGFRYVTQLAFMRRELAPYRRDMPRGDLEGIYYLPVWRERFATTLLATHSGTLDCPELNSHRSTEEVIAGFTLPEYPWSGYWLATSGAGDVGVFVVEVSADREFFDLSYLGIVPSARGRGYGDQLLRRVIYDASVAGCSFVTLSVDVRNAPAMKLYARHGFVEYERRGVWLATWPA